VENGGPMAKKRKKFAVGVVIIVVTIGLWIALGFRGNPQANSHNNDNYSHSEFFSFLCH
jgi:hypothetical protein